MPVDPRDEISDSVQRGRMTPDEAEAKLKELGLRPLAPDPDPADFEVMAERWWTLPMTITWIAWRLPEEVARTSEAFRSRASFWEQGRWTDGAAVYDGFILRPGKPANLLYLKTIESAHQVHARLPPGAITITRAEQILWKALSERALEGTGVRFKTGERGPIPKNEWDELEIVVEKNRDVLRCRNGRSPATDEYYDVLFKRTSVLAVWPAQKSDELAIALPKTISPFEPGHMPLYFAAQWIATRGGSADIDPCKLSIWERAYGELLARISSDEIIVTGRRGGQREKLDGYLFASMPIDHPFVERDIDLMLGEDLHLVSYPYIDEEHWRKGFDDSLRDRSGIRWSQLMIEKSNIARYWPFDQMHRPPVTHSGGAGRPSAMHLVEAEYDRRRALGELRGGIGAVAAELAKWAKSAYSNLQTPTARTIENRLRPKHRQSTK
jgi:hypothetical protein